MMPAPPEVGNKHLQYMPAVVHNTPACLIPKELFKEEKAQVYWYVLYPNFHCDSIAKDDLDNFYLLYPSSKNADSIHETTSMYNSLRKNFPQQSDAICINIYDGWLSLLALKDNQIAYAGYFCFSVREDILYHIANISQQFFEDLSQILIYYSQISTQNLLFLKEYFELKQL